MKKIKKLIINILLIGSLFFGPFTFAKANNFHNKELIHKEQKIKNNSEIYKSNSETPVEKYKNDLSLQKQFLNDINKNYQENEKYELQNTTINNYKSRADNLTFNLSPDTHRCVSNNFLTYGDGFDFKYGLFINNKLKWSDIWTEEIHSLGVNKTVDILWNINLQNIKKTDTVSLKIINTISDDENKDMGLNIEILSNQKIKNIINKLKSNVTSFNINSIKIPSKFGYDFNIGKLGYRPYIDNWKDIQIDITTNYKINKNYRKIIYSNTLYMSNYELQNTDIKSNTLKKILKFYEEEKLIQNIQWITQPVINKNTIRINGSFWFSGSEGGDSNIININIPIQIINFNYLFKASSSSSTMFDYSSDGSKKYWSKKPKTIIEINNKFIKTLNIWKNKKKLNNEVIKWTADYEKQKILRDKVNDGSLNNENKDFIKEALNQNNMQAIDAAQSTNYYKKISSSNKWNSTTNYNVYFNILKSSYLKFNTSFNNVKNWKFQDILDKEYQIDEDIIEKSESGKINWNVKLNHFSLVNNSEEIFIQNINGYKLDIDKNLKDDYGISLKILENETAIIHNYYYQAKGLDVSRDVSFIMADGTVLDRDYKVVSSTSLKKGEYAYKQIRYEFNDKYGKQYLLVNKDINGEWFSKKFNKKLEELDENFSEKNIQYVFNQEMNLIVNPYANTISKNVNPNEALKKGIKAIPNAWQYNGTFVGASLPALPKGIKHNINAYKINGITKNLKANIPKGIISTPYLYSPQNNGSSITKQKFLSLNSNERKMFAPSSWNVFGTTTKKLNEKPQDINGVNITEVKNSKIKIANNSNEEIKTENGITWKRFAIGHMGRNPRWLSNNNDGTWLYKKEYPNNSEKMDLNWKLDGKWYNTYYTEYTRNYNEKKMGSNFIENLKWNNEWNELKFHFKTGGDSANSKRYDNYKSDTTFTLKSNDGIRIKLNSNNKNVGNFVLTSHLNRQRYLLTTKNKNNFSIDVSWNDQGEINLNLYIDSAKTDSWTYIMLLDSIDIISKTQYKYSGIYKGKNKIIVPDGINVEPYSYKPNKNITKLEYDSLSDDLKKYFNIESNKWQGVYHNETTPLLPNGVKNSIYSYYIYGVYNSKLKSKPIKGVSVKAYSYELTTNITGNPINVIDFYGIPRYIIKDVIDKQNGKSQILESWNDGFWSHAKNEDKALFDGVFGTDMNGMQDGKGLLGIGEHKIQINLFKNNALKKNKFNIYIDFSPVDVDVESNGKLIKTTIIDKNKFYDMYYSDEPINFKVLDQDILDAKAYILSSDGKWYGLPLNIKSKLKNNIYYKYIDSTIDYSGFAKILITDRANNVKTIFFKLNKLGDSMPHLMFKKEGLLSRNKYQGKELFILNKNSPIILADPLAYNINLNKLVLSKNMDLISVNKNNLLSNYAIQQEKEYKYGKTIHQSKSKLNYIGDELKPFLKNLSTVSSWKTENKKISINQDGLYELNFKTKLINNQNKIIYIYLNKNKQITFPDQNNIFEEDQTHNFDHIKTKKISDILSTKIDSALLKEILIWTKKNHVKTKNGFYIDYDIINDTEFKNNPYIWKYVGSKINQNGKILEDYSYIDDVEIEMINNFKIQKFNFEIKSIKTYYSLPWYSEFIAQKNSYDFSKEGKYIIEITDLYDKKHIKKILIINKNKTQKQRNNSHDIHIYTNQNQENTAFWKGKMIWWLYRYEDANHAIWEKNNFINEAIKNGLNKKEEEIAYKHIKQDSKWNGDINNLPGGFSLKELIKNNPKELLEKNGFKKINNKFTLFDKNKNKDNTPENTLNKKRNKSRGLLWGTVAVGFTSLSLIIFLLVRRIKNRKIK